MTAVTDDDERQKATVYYTTKLPYYDPRAWVGELVLGLGPRWRLAQEVTLEDGRKRATDLDANGFELGRLPKITEQPKTHWLDAKAVAAELFPAAEAVLERRFPGAKALVFDHIVRGLEGPTLTSKPVPYAHNDYSVNSGKPRAKALLRDFATSSTILDEVMTDRVAIVNLWCPLSEVRRDPLAFVDWRTTRPEDLVVVKVKYATRDGETSVAYPSANHEWVSYPRMQPGEAILLKTWDSPPEDDLVPQSDSSQRSRFAIHSSAELTNTKGTDEPTRESIELRAMVLFHPKASTELLEKPFVAPHIARLDAAENKGFEKRVSTTLVDGDPRAFVPVLAPITATA